MEYDYLIVGSGIYGACFAHKASQTGKKCLVIDKRPQLGGNIYCENIEGINVHKYGAHIFHTNNKEIWNFLNSIVEFNSYTNSPIANYKGNLYNLPFNMNTFYKMWGTKTPGEAKAIIEGQKMEALEAMSKAGVTEPRNLEEQAITMVGLDIYEKLIKGYTEKQWGRKCTELPSFIIKRLPLRFVFDNNYFNSAYQGIPIGGYNKLIEGLLKGIETKLNTDYLENREYWNLTSKKILYTGQIDAFFNYQFGNLEYRTLHFETELLEQENFQGNAVVNYTSIEIPYTRIIEHKHFEFGTQPNTIITREYSKEWKKGDEPYYPINDEQNEIIYSKYKSLADKEEKIIFGGRLAEYKYYDMDKIVEKALLTFENLDYGE